MQDLLHGGLPVYPRRDIRWQRVRRRDLLIEQRLPRFRGGFSIHPCEASRKIKRILKPAAVGNFYDSQTSSPQQGHGELEFEEAKWLHGRMAE